jgi:hypothetical protein
LDTVLQFVKKNKGCDCSMVLKCSVGLWFKRLGLSK